MKTKIYKYKNKGGAHMPKGATKQVKRGGIVRSTVDNLDEIYPGKFKPLFTRKKKIKSTKGRKQRNPVTEE